MNRSRRISLLLATGVGTVLLGGCLGGAGDAGVGAGAGAGEASRDGTADLVNATGRDDLRVVVLTTGDGSVTRPRSTRSSGWTPRTRAAIASASSTGTAASRCASRTAPSWSTTTSATGRSASVRRSGSVPGSVT